MVGGDSGRWFGEIGMIAMGAVGASLLASVTLVPSASVLLAQRSTGRLSRVRFARLDLWLERLADRHHDLLAWSIGRRRAITAAALGIACIVFGLLVGVVKTDSTSRFIELDVRGPDAQTLFGVAQRVADELRRIDGVGEPVVSPTAHRDGESVARIEHVDGERVARVRTSVDDTRVSELLRDIDARLAALPLPPGYAVRQGGEIADREYTVSRLSRAFGVALALLSLMLSIRFRSLLAPLSILLGGSLAWLAASLALSVTGNSAGVLPLIGGGFLMVIVVRHGMQLLAAYESRRARGPNARVALVEAGRARLPPTITSICALVTALAPLGLVDGTSSGIQRSIAIALSGGLMASAIGTLYVMPAAHALLEDASLALGARLRARLPRGKRGIGVLPGADDHSVVSS